MIINCNTDLKKLCQSVGSGCNPCDANANLVLAYKGFYTDSVESQGINLKCVSIKVDSYQQSNPQIPSFGSAIVSPSNLHLLYTKSKDIWWAYYSDVFQSAIALNSLLKFSFTTTHFDQNNLTLQTVYGLKPYNDEVTFTWDNINSWGWLIENNWDINWTWNQTSDRGLQNGVMFSPVTQTETVILPYTSSTQIASGDVTAKIKVGDFYYDLTYTLTVNFLTNSYTLTPTKINLFGTVFKLSLPSQVNTTSSTITTTNFTAETEFKVFALNVVRLHSVNQMLSLAAYEQDQILLVNQGLLPEGLQIVNFNLPVDFDKTKSCGC